MYSEEIYIDKIEIVNFKIIQIRKVVNVLKDGVVIASNYLRSSFTEGQDISGEDERIVNISKIIWTNTDTLTTQTNSVNILPENISGSI